MTMLTEANYFSKESGQRYMSTSQLKRFLQCEALAYAELNGLYERETTTALLVGGYVDAYFSNTLGQYVAEHPQIYTQKGTMRAEFGQAQEIINYLEQDPLLLKMLSGEQQKIVTGEIAGVPFRGKLDSLLNEEQCHEIAREYPEMAADLLMAEGCITDLKVMRNMDPMWMPGIGRVSFVQGWLYTLQLGIYQRLINKNYPCFIVCATKESQPDKALIKIPQYMMSAALESVEELIPRYQAIKLGQIEPVRCEKCDWCKKTKVIKSAISADDLEGSE